MDLIEKLKKLWWIVFSFIIFINGFGFLYNGFKNNNKNWVLEGIAYEIPWLFCLIYAPNQAIFNKLMIIGMVSLLISIIRSIWVATKLSDIYDNEEKYTVRPTVVNNVRKGKLNDKQPPTMGCCLCLVFIFMIFAIVAIL